MELEIMFYENVCVFMDKEYMMDTMDTHVNCECHCVRIYYLHIENVTIRFKGILKLNLEREILLHNVTIKL